MKHVLEAETLAAMICLADSQALPQDFDAVFRAAPVSGEGNAFAYVSRLNDENKLLAIPTGANGKYLIHVYVDQSAPQSMRGFMHDPIRKDVLLAPSGRLRFCGIEKLVRESPSVDVAQVTMRPGNYSATLWRTEFPADMVEAAIRRAMGMGRNYLAKALSIATALAGIVGIALMVMMIVKGFEHWLMAAFMSAFIVAMGGTAALRSAYFRSMDADKKTAEQDFPSIVAELEWVRK